MRELMIGGRAIEQATLIRFYVLHIVILPGLLGALFAYHMWRVRKDGGLARADAESALESARPTAVVPTKTYTLLGVARGVSPAVRASTLEAPDVTVNAVPDLVRRAWIVTLGTIAVISIASVFIASPLEEPASSVKTPNPSKAPWYFLGLPEMLLYFDPWIAGVILPTIILIGLILIPYIDINPKGNGYYTFKERPFAIATFVIGFVVLWVALIVLGTFMRGPGWYYFWPWEYWDTHRVVALTNVDLVELVGLSSYNIDGSISQIQNLIGATIFFGWLVAIPLWVWKKYKNTSAVLQKLGPVKYATTMVLFLMMAGLPIKMFLRLAFNVKYVWVFGFGHDLFFNI